MHVDSPMTFNKICANIHVHANYRKVGAGGLGGEQVKDKQTGWQTNKQTDRVADRQRGEDMTADIETQVQNRSYNLTYNYCKRG